MLDKEWSDYFRRRLAESQEELADFKQLVATRSLRVWHRSADGETDMTDENLRRLEEAVREYQWIVDKEERAPR